MQLRLTRLPDTLRGPKDPAYRGKVPSRARFLAPDAAVSFMELENDVGPLVWTDILRSAESSLLAVRTKRGVQPPGYSGHNFGLSVDADVDAILKEKKWKYRQLLGAFEAHGWFCHRRDGKQGFESWHFNYLGPSYDDFLSLTREDRPDTWDEAIEARIRGRYGPQFALDAQGVQMCLAKLGFYGGKIDGKLGALSAQAVAAFQRAWLLSADGVAGPRTKRTLAFVSAETVLV